MIITDCISKNIRSLSEDLLLDLTAPPTWLDDAVNSYNRIAATTEPDRLVSVCAFDPQSYASRFIAPLSA
jgi:hypothetical protein